MSLITSIFLALTTFIITTCGFLFRHTLKSIFIDPGSDPRLVFDNNKTNLSIKVRDTSSLENSLESRVKTEMEGEWQKYAPKDLDPYKNPWLTIPDNLYSVTTRNSCNELYLKSREQYLRNTLNAEIIERRWIPVDIYIVNKGSIATKSMRVIIKGAGNLYSSTKFKNNSGKCYQPPTGKERFNRNVFAGPEFYLKGIDYQYLTITEEESVQNELRYNIETPVRQGQDNRIKLDTLYLDASKAMSIDLEWNIYEDSLGKNGNHGVLKIDCLSQ